jgi:ABC-type sugar transport system permease subunit
MSIYQTAFADTDVGLASAMSVVLIIVVGLITFIQFHYLQGDGD